MTGLLATEVTQSAPVSVPWVEGCKRCDARRLCQNYSVKCIQNVAIGEVEFASKVRI